MKPAFFIGPAKDDLHAFPRANTFRAVYTVRFAKAIYVLHAFQKKFKIGVATSRHDIDVIKLRSKAAASHYDEHFPKDART